MKIISIDVANKSLAVSCLDINRPTLNKVKHSIWSILNSSNESDNSNHYNIIKEFLNHTEITIYKLIVKDLIPGKRVKDTNLIHRSRRLYDFLTTLLEDLNKNWIDNFVDAHIIIEYQMGNNKKTNDIQAQLIMFFMRYTDNIHIIGPSLKNKLYILNDSMSNHSYHIEQTKTLYPANKSHTRYLFLKWLNCTNNMHLLQQIDKKNYDDIADSFCQAIAWCRLNHSK